MFTNRFISLLVAISVLVVAVLMVQESRATASPIANMDSATRSYTAWAKAAEAEASTVDSDFLDYIAQAKAVGCSVDTTYDPNLDSATRSYIAWGLALQAKNDIGALCH